MPVISVQAIASSRQFLKYEPHELPLEFRTTQYELASSMPMISVQANAVEVIHKMQFHKLQKSKNQELSQGHYPVGVITIKLLTDTT